MNRVLLPPLKLRLRGATLKSIKLSLADRHIKEKWDSVILFWIISDILNTQNVFISIRGFSYLPCIRLDNKYNFLAQTRMSHLSVFMSADYCASVISAVQQTVFNCGILSALNTQRSYQNNCASGSRAACSSFNSDFIQLQPAFQTGSVKFQRWGRLTGTKRCCWLNAVGYRMQHYRVWLNQEQKVRMSPPLMHQLWPSCHFNLFCFLFCFLQISNCVEVQHSVTGLPLSIKLNTWISQNQ